MKHFYAQVFWKSLVSMAPHLSAFVTILSLWKRCAHAPSVPISGLQNSLELSGGGVKNFAVIPAPSLLSAVFGHRLSDTYWNRPDLELYVIIAPLNPWEYKWLFWWIEQTPKSKYRHLCFSDLDYYGYWIARLILFPHVNSFEKELEWYIRHPLLEYVSVCPQL